MSVSPSSALAHPEKAELGTQLQHAQGLGERLGRGLLLRGDLVQHLSHHQKQHLVTMFSDAAWWAASSPKISHVSRGLSGLRRRW